MTDSEDSEKKPFRAFSEEQRKKLAEKVKQVVQQNAAPPADATTDKSTRMQTKGEQLTRTPAEKSTDPTPKTKTHSSQYQAFDAKTRAAIERKVAEKLKQKEQINELRKRLLSMAGKQVVINDKHPFNELLMQRGQTWNSFDVNLISGPEYSVLLNVVRLWQKNPDFYKIVTGYALDAAGVWRLHGWLLVRGVVNEVSLKHAVYYGVPLNSAEAERFAEWVLTTKS